MQTPPYLQIVEYFRTLIDDGDFRPGEKLPSNREVGLIRGVSRETVSKAFKELQRLGYVKASHEGTFVREGVRHGEDAGRRTQLEDVLASWESAGYIGPAWTVRWDGGDGAYRIEFTLFNTWGPEPRAHNFSEAEFEIYAMALAEWFPDEAGQAAVAFALNEEP